MSYTEADLRAVKQIKAAARAVVTLSAGLLSGAQQVPGSIMMLPPHLRISHPAINAFLQEVPADVPLGESRLYVAQERLLEADQALVFVENTHRSAVLLECRASISLAPRFSA